MSEDWNPPDFWPNVTSTHQWHVWGSCYYLYALCHWKVMLSHESLGVGSGENLVRWSSAFNSVHTMSSETLRRHRDHPRVRSFDHVSLLCFASRGLSRWQKCPGVSGHSAVWCDASPATGQDTEVRSKRWRSGSLVVTSASLLVTSATLVVTRFATSNKCIASSNKCHASSNKVRY